MVRPPWDRQVRNETMFEINVLARCLVARVAGTNLCVRAGKEGGGWNGIALGREDADATMYLCVHSRAGFNSTGVRLLLDVVLRHTNGQSACPERQSNVTGS